MKLFPIPTVIKHVNAVEDDGGEQILEQMGGNEEEMRQDEDDAVCSGDVRFCGWVVGIVGISFGFGTARSFWFLGGGFSIVNAGYQGGVCVFARLGYVVCGLLLGGWVVCV